MNHSNADTHNLDDFRKKAYEQGRADERAAVIAWLHGISEPDTDDAYIADRIKVGAHTA